MALRRRQLGSFQAFFADKGVRSILVQIGVWTAIGVYALNLDNAAHLGGFVSGFAACWVMSSAPAARRNGWLAIGAAVAALFVFAARPWWTPAGRDANDFVAYRERVSHRQRVRRPTAAAPWPHDVARGERFLDKGCKHGVGVRVRGPRRARRTTWARPTPREQSKALRRRASELDPGLEQQLH